MHWISRTQFPKSLVFGFRTLGVPSDFLGWICPGRGEKKPCILNSLFFFFCVCARQERRLPEDRQPPMRPHGRLSHGGEQGLHQVSAREGRRRPPPRGRTQLMAGGSFQVRLCDDAPLAQQQQRYEAVGAALDQKLPVWRVVAPHPVHAGLKGRSLARWRLLPPWEQTRRPKAPLLSRRDRWLSLSGGAARRTASGVRPSNGPVVVENNPNKTSSPLPRFVRRISLCPVTAL